MSPPSSRCDYFRPGLGLFVLGALPLDDHLAVETHLARCERCRAECEELSEVPAVLSMLCEEDVRSLADEFAPAERQRGWMPGTRSIEGDGRSPGPVRPKTLNGASPRRTGRVRPEPLRPRGRGRGVRGRVATLSSWPRGRLVLAVIMITLSLGIGIGTYLQASSTGPTVPTTLAASATNRTTGASASIVVTGHGEGSHVEATFGGLQPGIQYQLFAVTVRAKTNVVTRWIGADSQTTVRAELNTRPQDLAFFTVTGMDGAVVVSVRLTADAATP